MLDRFCMMQNLRRFFDSTSLPFLTDDVIEAFGRAFESNSTGPQISSILSEITSGRSADLPQRMQHLHGGKLQPLDEDLLHLLRDQQQPGCIAVSETRAIFYSTVESKGFKIRPRNSSLNDSNILYRTSSNHSWSAGQVTQIFSCPRTIHQDQKTEVLLVVEELAELRSSEIQSDVYRRFPAFKARLYHDRVTCRRVVTLDSFLCQFARKVHRSHNLGKDLVLVFPITKVSQPLLEQRSLPNAGIYLGRVLRLMDFSTFMDGSSMNSIRSRLTCDSVLHLQCLVNVSQISPDDYG